MQMESIQLSEVCMLKSVSMQHSCLVHGEVTLQWYSSPAAAALLSTSDYFPSLVHLVLPCVELVGSFPGVGLGFKFGFITPEGFDESRIQDWVPE